MCGWLVNASRGLDQDGIAFDERGRRGVTREKEWLRLK